MVDGLIKNAVENTPDQGMIEIEVKKRGEGSELKVVDCGVGLTEESRRRIFEGFFTTRDTMHYSSKRPFDFNAGGKGMDLLRMKIFSERYHFTLKLNSKQCGPIAGGAKDCLGNMDECDQTGQTENCLESGGTSVTVQFYPADRFKKQ